MYNEKLIEKSKYYWDKNPMVATADKEFDSEIKSATRFLDRDSPVMRHRLYCVINNVTDFPKCPVCGGPVHLHDVNPKLGFRKLCSQECRSTDNKISKEAQSKLDDCEWLYEQRITLKKSKETIAEELGVSIVPVNSAIKRHKIPSVKYNESDYKVKAKLEDKGLLEEMYGEGHTLEAIAEKLGTSKATLSTFFAKHGIETRDPNSYERQFKKQSGEELDLLEWIKSVYHGEIRTSVKNLSGPNMEVDIYLPELNFAIEYNGLYSHIYRPEEKTPSLIKGPSYHYMKTVNCRANNVFLFHLWSDLWTKQKDKVQFYILNKLELNRKIYARRCTIREVETHDKNEFLDRYHLQGADKSKLKYGLYHNEELVSLMTFSVPNRTRARSDYEWELKRFCSKGGVNVVGGFSKLLAHFRKLHSGTIVSYADMSYSDGGVYKNNGFKKFAESGPSYQYVILNQGIRVPKTSFTKSHLTGGLGGRVKEMSEREIMETLNIPILYDCGTETYVI